jgi:hypothetical protein
VLFNTLCASLFVAGVKFQPFLHRWKFTQPFFTAAAVDAFQRQTFRASSFPCGAKLKAALMALEFKLGLLEYIVSHLIFLRDDEE